MYVAKMIMRPNINIIKKDPVNIGGYIDALV